MIRNKESTTLGLFLITGNKFDMTRVLFQYVKGKKYSTEIVKY